MAYKRYFYKNGKKFGPYYYESYRDKNGIVRKRYVGTTIKDTKSFKKTKSFITPTKIFAFILILALILTIGVLIYKKSVTGKITLIKDQTLLIKLKEGELLPLDSRVIIEQNNTTAEIFLRDLIESNAEGVFYIEDAELTGEGAGYGFIGEKTTYPTITFKFKIIPRETTETEVEEPEVVGEPEVEEPEVTEEEVKAPEVEEVEAPEESAVEAPEETENTEPETSPITGEVVSEEEITGETSKGNPFTYGIGDSDIEILSVDKGSVNDLIIKEKDGILTISTDYSETEQGFGEDFLTDKTKSIELELNNLGVQKNYIKVSLVYEDVLLAETSSPPEEELEEIPANLTEEANLTTELSIIKEIGKIKIIKNSNFTLQLDEYFSGAGSYSAEEKENLNTTLEENSLIIIPDENYTGETEMLVSAFKEEQSVSQNFTILVEEETPINESELNITTRQYKAIINRPVKWIKTLNMNQSQAENLTLTIPKQAENITIKTGEEVQQALQELEEYKQVIEASSKEDIMANAITGDVSLELKKSNGILIRLWKWVIKISVTGKVIQEEEIEEQIIETEKNKEVNLGQIVQAEEVAVEYYTDAPQAVEETTSSGKRITISAPDELNYTDILAYTSLENEVSSEIVKLYNVEEGAKTEVQIDKYDLNNNGLIDYVEWIVPHLSNQTYELILIAKAEHLDENRTFVNNIYSEVYQQDNVWSETINNNEYVRVTFEQNLTSSKDITIYARANNCSTNNSVIINGTEVPCDIYQKKKRIDEIRRLLEE